MLRCWYHVEELLVNSLSLPAGIAPLHPGVIPVWVNLFTGNIHLAVLHCEQGAVFTEANLRRTSELMLFTENTYNQPSFSYIQSGMEASGALCYQYSAS